MQSDSKDGRYVLVFFPICVLILDVALPLTHLSVTQDVETEKEIEIEIGIEEIVKSK